MKKQKLMTEKIMGILLVSTYYIESRLKCILKSFLPKNLKLFLSKVSPKDSNEILKSKIKNRHWMMVKKSIVIYGNNIDNFSIGAIVHLINIIKFKKLINKKYSYFSDHNIQFIINNIYLISAIRNTLSHPKCEFNIKENLFFKKIGLLKQKNNWNYQSLIQRLFIIRKILDKILIP